MNANARELPPNEPLRDYAPGPARDALKAALSDVRQNDADIPLFIGAEQRHTGEGTPVVMPHRHGHRLATSARASASDVEDAIVAAQRARADWAGASHSDRARVFLRAAELIAGPHRDAMNAATMLGQSKTAHQAEIDAACELIDFLRFNCAFAARALEFQPMSPGPQLNELELRPLDGFVLAVTPFNFTAIAGNLPTAPALMGNTVVWKPSPTQMRAAFETMKVLEVAGLPPGVINMVSGDPELIGSTALSSEHLAGIHFTGSTRTFQHLFKTVGNNLHRYRSYPRIVGETGGKDFIVAHPSADRDALMTAIIRGGYEYQGQKCSAASRLFISESVWADIEEPLVESISKLKMGDPEDFSTFLSALIDERAFDKVLGYLELARADEGATVLVGGRADKSEGYFAEPTLVRVRDPKHRLMTEEIFGPFVTCLVYPDREYEAILDACDQATEYALTGAIFARDRAAIRLAADKLRFAAGNFYINDKPTGAVVNQQPFGGSRRSGTNDKAGSLFNLLRWVSPWSIKENFLPPTEHLYPYMTS